MAEAQRLYWDACVFLSYLNDMPERVGTITTLLDKAKKGEVEIYTSTFSIVEVAFAEWERTKKIIDHAVERRLDEFWADRDAIKLVEVHEYVQREARRLMREGLPKGWSLRPADAIHLATATRMDVSEINTYEGTKWTRYAAELGVSIREPYVAQVALDLEG